MVLRKIMNSELPVLTPYSTSELVFGLVCAVGTGLDLVIKTIKDRLSIFGYTVEVIDVADDILSGFNKDFREKGIKIDRYKDNYGYTYDNSNNKRKPGKYEATHEMMDVGNSLRGANLGLLGMGIVERILNYREKQGREGNILPKTAFIIKSLKNEAEVDVLRSVYGNGFYLFGVHSDEERRLDYLKKKGMDEKSAKDLIKRDEHEEPGYGQQTRDTFRLSDFFVSNKDSTSNVQANILRIMDLIFGDPFITPTFSEYAMFSAYCASLRTADLSRQIGAVICKGKDILASGANECPQYGGGQYWLEYDNEDNRYYDFIGGRDHMLGFDSNKREFQKLAIESFDVIIELIQEAVDRCENELERQTISKKLAEIVGEEKINKNFVKKLKDETGLGDLTEYGRVVHAEMEALSACARNGISCKGGELYCTTFPCHVCTKHLIAAGITKVVYIEPYPKSKALDLFKDSISTDESDKGEKIVFTPFFGVGPRRFIELFSMNYTPLLPKIRKDPDGNKKEWNPDNAIVRDQMLPSSYIEREINYATTYSEWVSMLFTEEEETL